MNLKKKLCILLIIVAGMSLAGCDSISKGSASSGSETVDYSDASNPVATIFMENGDVIKVELYPKAAPNTVNNFIYLAGSGFYDGLTFHRIVPGFVIQGGDPSGNGTGGPGYSIKGEFYKNGTENKQKHTKGIISMARAKSYDSAGSQFFIMLDDAANLDGLYAAFGKVIEGMDVADKIAVVKRGKNDKPLEPVKISKITVDMKGKTYSEPEKTTK
ncbi:MAG: peptidylprolyl isomerase [Clostridiaceae bacterium]